MSEAGKAVFLSYASQDAEAAKRIAEALRAAGVEVWFDQNELVGGDAWDSKIRGQISSCALFVPVISANTQARLEGYFRIEWKIAARRTHAMATAKAFLLPVVIDDTTDAAAHAPEEFRDVQWTRLKDGIAPPVFCERVKLLLGGAAPAAVQVPNVGQTRGSAPPLRKVRIGKGAFVVAVICALAAAGTWLALRQPTKGIPSVSDAAPNPAVARARTLVTKLDVTRAELDTASELLARAGVADPSNARIFAAWAMVDARFLSDNYDNSSARREALGRHVSQAVGLDVRDPEVRLARATAMTTLDPSRETRLQSVALLRELQREMPDDPRVYDLLGWRVEDRAAGEAWWDRQATLAGQAAKVAFNRAYSRIYRHELRTGYPALAKALDIEKSTKGLLWKSYLDVVWLGDVAAAQRTIAQVPAEEFVEDMAGSARNHVAFYARDYEGALAAARAIPRDFLSSNAGAFPTGQLRGEALRRLGRNSAAETEWRVALAATERRLSEQRDEWSLIMSKALLLASLGDKAAAEALRREAHELNGERPYDWLEDNVAVAVLAPGDAITRLEGLVRGHQGWATAAVLRLNPAYDHLRADPRFAALQAAADADPRLSPDAQDRVPATAADNAVTIDSKSVAVLAFANLSDDKANEYFSDGISEELLNVLAKVPGLKVTARTSSFHFKGTSTAIPEIAKQLGVAYVVEGSVRKSGDKVRITAQLIKAADGFHVWSDTFTRDLKDVFAVQDEIAGLVAKNLEAKLGTSVRSGAMVDGQAFELYMRGRAAWNRRNAEGFTRAETLFRQALDIAPDFARAHAALADVWMIRAISEGKLSLYGQRASPVIAPIETEVQRALELDPGSAEAHATLGFLRELQHRPEEALRLLQRSVELNPNYATGHHWLAGALAHRGLFDESIREYERAVAIDPLSPRILDNYGASLAMLGRFKEALVLLDRSLDLMPGQPQALFGKILTLAKLGRRDEARALATRATAEYRIQILAGIGDQAEIAAALTNADRAGRFLLLCATGRPDEALNFFHVDDVSLEDAPGWFFEPRLVPFHGDPRFLKVITELGLEDAFARARAWVAAHPPEKTEAKP